MQLKRNKEMEFETLKKRHKKQIVIGALAICVIGGALTFETTKAKYKLTQDIKLATGTINYTPYDYRISYINKNGVINTCSTSKCEEMLNYIPNSANYILNSNSYCETKNASGIYERNSNIILTHQNTTITTNIKKNKARCYLYFDERDTTKPTISNVTTSVTKTEINVTVTASDNVGVTEYWYQIDSNAVVKGTGNTYKFTGLAAGSTHTIKVYVKDASGNQSTTATKSVTTSAPTSEDTLTKLGITNVNTTTPDFSKIATTSEGVFKVADGMYGGTSYYWRGSVTNNYIKFAGFCWRIIRINGDGSIRLIYDGSTCHANGTSTTDSIAKTSTAYNSNYNNSAYVGWTYTVGAQRPTPSTGGTTSNAKAQLESWYNSTITGTNASKVADGKYCNDRNVQSGNTWSATGLDFNYSAYQRLRGTYQPTLSCETEDTYTLKVGLITLDEAMYAGGKYYTNNTSYYLYNGQNYWSMSPYNFGGSVGAGMFVIDTKGYITGYFLNYALGLRPVINLHSDVTFSSGDGTLNNPYIVS